MNDYIFLMHDDAVAEWDALEAAVVSETSGIRSAVAEADPAAVDAADRDEYLGAIDAVVDASDDVPVGERAAVRPPADPEETAERFESSVDSGALVAEVEPNGPADEAGVEPQDVVTAAGPTEIRSSGDLLAALRDYTPGDAIQLTVVREGEERKVSVELGERRD